MDSIARESLLYDFYGSLLTDKKRSVMECYHEDDMSLAEIADEMGISRAAVHDSLKSAEAQLEQYESKLGLLAKYEKAHRLADEANAMIDELEQKCVASEAAGKAGVEAETEAGSITASEEAARLRAIIEALASNEQEQE